MEAICIQMHFGLLHHMQPATSKKAQKGPLVRAPRTMSQPHHTQTEQQTTSSHLVTKRADKEQNEKQGEVHYKCQLEEVDTLAQMLAFAMSPPQQLVTVSTHYSPPTSY